MKNVTGSNVPASLVKAFEASTLSRSAAISQAIHNADRCPDLLVYAFRLRLSLPFEENDTRITYTRNAQVTAIVEKLASMTKLPNEQVVRLCMEAYVHCL